MIAAARSARPREAVGIIAGNNPDPLRFIPLLNLAAEEGSFRIDEAEFARLARSVRIQAFFHSHPTDIAAPSTLDIAGARDWPDALHFIYAFQPEECLKCWRIFDGQVMPEPIEIE